MKSYMWAQFLKTSAPRSQKRQGIQMTHKYIHRRGEFVSGQTFIVLLYWLLPNSYFLCSWIYFMYIYMYILTCINFPFLKFRSLFNTKAKCLISDQGVFLEWKWVWSRTLHLESKWFNILRMSFSPFYMKLLKQTTEKNILALTKHHLFFMKNACN